MTEILRYAAFTTTPEGGNPAGVVLDAADLAESQMQSIAKAVGYSETAFVLDGGSGDPSRHTVRYFSPLAEVPFCGHATIATGVALAAQRGPGTMRFDTPAGTIPVDTFEDESGMGARLRSVATRSTPATRSELERALAALRWSASELGDLPAHVAFGGVDHLVLAAATRERLAELDYDFAGLQAVMSECGWTTLQLIYVESDTVIHARDPFPVGGVVEDPATGAAAAALGGYLRTIGRVTRPVTISILQGYDMGRPSTLTIEVDPADPRVVVSGHAVPIPAP